MDAAAGTPPGVAMGIEVLGPFRLRVGSGEVEVPGAKRRAVLALLAMAAPEPLSVDGLVDALWPAEPPAAARAALQSHVSRVRRHLGPCGARVSSAGAGYRLALEPGELDAAVATGLVEQARRAAGDDPARAVGLLRRARASWRGPALDGFVDVAPLAAWGRALEELRLDASDLLVECALEVGDAAEAAVVAAETVTAEPLREASVLGLMRALASCGRSVDALRAAHEYRNRLAEESGLEPTRAVAELEHSIASGSLDPPVPPVVVASPAPLPVPAPPAELIGRAAELAGVTRLLEAEQVVTVVGPGGVGKTHLALEAARHAQVRRDVVILGLAPVTDGAAIPNALAAALGLRAVAGDLLAACAERLRSGRHLLVVDNCEHVLDAARAVVATLAGACSGLTILATSRERLGLPIELTCRLMPLPMPEPERIHRVGDVPSVALFVDRARRVRPGFAPDPEELEVIAEIVRRLDGMPLAIELAAGRLSSLSLTDLGDRLDRALDLLGTGPSTDGRHRSLRAAIEWSYELLPDDEQRLFRSLAVFPDGFDLSTAESIALDVGCSVDPATAIAHLVDASMLVASLDEAPRYRMLDTLRSFGVDRLEAEGEHDAAVGRLLRLAAGLARWIGAAILSEDEALADVRLRTELANLRAAWRTARASGDLDTATTLVLSLGDAAIWRDYTEIWGWARELADDPALVRHPAAAAVFAEAADAAWKGAGDLDAGERLAQRGIELVRADDEWARKRCIAALGDVELFRGRYDRALALSREAARPPSARADAFGVAALAAAYAGDLEEAAELSAAMTDSARSPTLVGFARYVAAEIDGLAQAWDAAESHYRAALALAAESGATFLEGIASLGLVSVLAASGQVHEALSGYRDLVDYWERTSSWTQQWTTLRNLASLLDDLGDGETAQFLRSAADRAPEAPALARAGPTASPAPGFGPSRNEVLDGARQAIDRQLSSTVSAS